MQYVHIWTYFEAHDHLPCVAEALLPLLTHFEESIAPANV